MDFKALILLLAGAIAGFVLTPIVRRALHQHRMRRQAMAIVRAQFKSFRPLPLTVTWPRRSVRWKLHIACAIRARRPSNRESATMTSSKPHKLTPAQLAVLTNLAGGQRWDAHLSGRSAYGGARSTLMSLQRHGYIKAGAITQEGREALTGHK